MNIYDAIGLIEQFLETYPSEHGGVPAPWAPTETRILPSGDDNDHIKLWFNFGPQVPEDQIRILLAQLEDGLAKDLPELSQYTLEIRGDAF